MKLYLRLAWRNLWRHRRRTLIVVVAMARGLGLMMWYDGLMAGFDHAIYGNAIKVLGGNIQIHAEGYRTEMGENPLLALPDDQAAVQAALVQPLVQSATRRIITGGLLTSPEGAFGVNITGIEPEKESEVNLAAQHVIVGRYLNSEDQDMILIGQGLADAMDVTVGDRITMVGRSTHEQTRRRTMTVAGGIEGFDAEVIGSGIGRLAAASLLAQVAGKRVLVLERHFRPGGFTHAFQRHAWHWDVGVHYVGGMAEGQAPRRLFDLASGGALTWTKMPPRFERFVYPGLTLEVSDDVEAYRSALAGKFPAERAGIDRWFRSLSAGAAWAQRHFMGLVLPRPAAALLDVPGRSLALRTTAEVLDDTVRDPVLKAVLASQWGDYGLPPSLSAFAVHALIATHYFKGAYYPDGESSLEY